MEGSLDALVGLRACSLIPTGDADFSHPAPSALHWEPCSCSGPGLHSRPALDRRPSGQTPLY